MPVQLLFWFFVLLLTLLLWFPLSKLFWVWSVRRKERRRGQPLDGDERHAALKHSRAGAAVVGFAIAWTVSVIAIGNQGAV